MARMLSRTPAPACPSCRSTPRRHRRQSCRHRIGDRLHVGRPQLLGLRAQFAPPCRPSGPVKLLRSTRPAEFGGPGGAARDVAGGLAQRGVAVAEPSAARCRLAWTSASGLAHRREPTSTPSAPSISAAARPRPSAMPPAATSSVSGLRRASRSATSGTSVMVARLAPWPPASVPWATMMSAPTSSAALGVLHVLHLADQQPARRLDGRGEWARIAERQHHRGRRVRQRRVQHGGLRRQRPGDEAAADAGVAGLGELVREPVAHRRSCRRSGRARRRR